MTSYHFAVRYFGFKGEMQANAARLPQIDGHVCTPAEDPAAGTAVLRLSPQ